MRSGFKAGVVPADTDVKASRPVQLCEDANGTEWRHIEIFAPKGDNGVTGNDEAVWVGFEGTSAVPDYEAGLPLHPGDSWQVPKSPCRLCDLWLAVTTDGDKVTWIAF
jgi:hypothetical protein